MLIIKQNGKYYLPATTTSLPVELSGYKEDGEDVIIYL
jgi:hypothetical protein